MTKSGQPVSAQFNASARVAVSAFFIEFTVPACSGVSISNTNAAGFSEVTAAVWFS